MWFEYKNVWYNLNSARFVEVNRRLEIYFDSNGDDNVVIEDKALAERILRAIELSKV